MKSHDESSNLRRFLVSNFDVTAFEDLSPPRKKPKRLESYCFPKTSSKTFKLKTLVQSGSMMSRSNCAPSHTDPLDKFSEIGKQIAIKGQFKINEKVILRNLMDALKVLLEHTKDSDKILRFMRSFIFVDPQAAYNTSPDGSFDIGRKEYTFKDIFSTSDLQAFVRKEQNGDLEIVSENQEKLELRLFFAKLRLRYLKEKLVDLDKLKKDNTGLKRDLFDLRSRVLENKLNPVHFETNFRNSKQDQFRLKMLEEKYLSIVNEYQASSIRSKERIASLKAFNTVQAAELVAVNKKCKTLVQQAHQVNESVSVSVSELETLINKLTMLEAQSKESQEPKPHRLIKIGANQELEPLSPVLDTFNNSTATSQTIKTSRPILSHRLQASVSNSNCDSSLGDYKITKIRSTAFPKLIIDYQKTKIILPVKEGNIPRSSLALVDSQSFNLLVTHFESAMCTKEHVKALTDLLNLILESFKKLICPNKKSYVNRVM